MISKRRIARLLCVEVCYSSYFSDSSKDELIKAAISLNKAEYMKKFDPVLLDPVLDVCIANKDTDHSLIDQFLDSRWEIERIDFLKLSILRIAISELRVFGKEVRNLVIDEYVTLSRLFLPIDETHFINAILDNLLNTLVD